MTEAQLRDAQRALLADACRASTSVGVTTLAMRVDGKPVTPEVRDELIAKANAGEFVELEVDIFAFEQLAGVSNRKYIRFRDGAMMGLGRSGRGKPLLRDHEQDDVNARAGTITASDTEKRDEGSYAIKQTAVLRAPWAVLLALRGLLDTVSIGWNPTGPVECSVCEAPVFSKCWHFAGDKLSEQIGDDGKKRMVRDRAGSVIVEWIFTAAELVETSVVSVPAVPSAHIEGIRAALSAAHGGDIPSPEEGNYMDPELLALLGLAATAGKIDVLTAVRALQADRTELALAKSELAVVNVEIKTFKADRAKLDADAFIAGALSSGRIVAGDEATWREFFALSPDRARTRMSERLEGSATPVGQPRASGAPVVVADPKAGAGGNAGKEPGRAYVEKNGVNYDESVRLAAAFGAKDPHKAIANHVAGLEV